MDRKMHISECSDEQVLAQDVTVSKGDFFLPRGTPLNVYIIRKLRELGVEYLLVSFREKNSEMSHINRRAFEKRYENSVDEMKRLVLGLARGERIHYSTIDRISRLIVYSRDEPKHVLNCLGRIRDTDNYTYYHCLNVALYATMIAGWLNLVRDDIGTVVQAALLHDLGKAKISNEILNKNEELSWHEMEEIKRHPIYGYEMVKEDPHIPEEVKDAILMHHEREDGSGYPLGVSGEKLNIYTKIVAVADVYDAMTSDRPYKRGITPFEAFEEFLTVSRGGMDMHIVNTLLYNMSRYYIGSKVLLSNGETGSIVYIPPDCICKPIVDTGMAFLDLSREKGISVTGIA